MAQILCLFGDLRSNWTIIIRLGACCLANLSLNWRQKQLFLATDSLALFANSIGVHNRSENIAQVFA